MSGSVWQSQPRSQGCSDPGNEVAAVLICIVAGTPAQACSGKNRCERITNLS